MPQKMCFSSEHTCLRICYIDLKNQDQSIYSYSFAFFIYFVGNYPVMGCILLTQCNALPHFPPAAQMSVISAPISPPVIVGDTRVMRPDKPKHSIISRKHK